jgi:glucan-binding YG repeat protein
LSNTNATKKQKTDIPKNKQTNRKKHQQTNKQRTKKQKQPTPQKNNPKAKQNKTNKKTEKRALFLVTPVEFLLLQPSDNSQRRTGRKFDYDKQNIFVVICHTDIP